ncbi:MAG: DUF1592 domain-containing protein [Planctomyces sp.]|nr:DUF1592 domain-containing protein [Planctomyces sp.]
MIWFRSEGTATASGNLQAQYAITSSNGSGAELRLSALTGSAQRRPQAAATSNQAGTPQFASLESEEAEADKARRQKWLETDAIPYLAKYCVDCHGSTEQMGGVAVHDLHSIDQLLSDRKKWERVYRMINAGAMPPTDHDPKPTVDEQLALSKSLYDELFSFDCTEIRHPGRTTIQRLNRAEYNNTIRDLFGVSLTPADKFPSDDVGEGFDNIGDVLSLPPLLMEKYLDAAEEVASAVIDIRDFSKPQSLSFTEKQLTSTAGNEPAAGFYLLPSSGMVSASVDIPADGTWLIRIEAAADQAGDEKARMGLMVDTEQVQEFEIRGRRRPGWYEFKTKLTAGKYVIGGRFLNDYYNPEAEEGNRDRNLGIRAIELQGPFEGSAPVWHETHRRFVTVRPGETISVTEAASQVLKPVLYRAFRRPVSDEEVSRYASLVNQQVSEYHETYDYGLFVALQAILVSPDFLFLMEKDPDNMNEERPLNEYEVASRLSYFLWSSMPDEELFQVAENRRLLDREILGQQIRRMLKDEKSKTLGENFASQWLNLRNLKDVRPNPDVFPDFDDALRVSMARETEIFFNTIVKEDRSLDEFLSADYTFVNERLARHYGLQGITGEEYVRVSLGGTNRAGVLTHASILTLTSNPGRTSPVKRGKWIMENILGEAPPPAPPAVPQLEETAKAMPNLSLREQLELHRKDPGCASCHKSMDPLGLGFENFDATGRWREKDGEKPIDASGELPSGQKFNGAIELIGIVRDRREQFHRALTERMMVYALGRGLEYYDKCAVDKSLELQKQHGFRFSALIEGIVTSDPFLKKGRTREIPVTAGR